LEEGVEHLPAEDIFLAKEEKRGQDSLMIVTPLKYKTQSPYNILTIDVEDWFHASALAEKINSVGVDRCQSRVSCSLHRVLDLLDEEETKATFFVLGSVAERFPEIVRAIKQRNHEVASHGFAHHNIHSQTREVFKEDVRRSLSVLENITGEKIKGYRAPNFSITTESLWAYEILAGLGIEYSSSIFPTKHILQAYGIPQAPKDPFILRSDDGKSIVEFPLSTVRILGKSFPFGGGAYLRLFPYWYSKWSIRRLNRGGKPATIYFHPWELDPDQPRLDLNLLARTRHYFNLDIMETKIRGLLKAFRFQSIEETLQDDLAPTPVLSQAVRHQIGKPN
jgi:polysaccharide deacetylase family protein (PEP-CTERM system associated)